MSEFADDNYSSVELLWMHYYERRRLERETFDRVTLAVDGAAAACLAAVPAALRAKKAMDEFSEVADRILEERRDLWRRMGEL